MPIVGLVSGLIAQIRGAFTQLNDP